MERCKWTHLRSQSFCPLFEGVYCTVDDKISAWNMERCRFSQTYVFLAIFKSPPDGHPISSRPKVPNVDTYLTITYNYECTEFSKTLWEIHGLHGGNGHRHHVPVFLLPSRYITIFVIDK
uniref:Uncharacterized protein n=1 Tax=Cacopsylla melanoneura TaxID=428564 RepID=A0A8D8W768_9HEMI